MIKTPYFGFLFCLLLLFSACKDDKTAVSILFKLTYDDAPLVMFEDYVYPDGKKLQITRFSFYMSQLSVNDRTESILLKDVDFINLTKSHSSTEGASQGYTYMAKELQLDGFDAISFDFGLTEVQNMKVPADFSPGHPMSKPGEYWVAWDSYIFVKIEGWIDLDGDEMPETGLALHLGSDAVNRSVAMPVHDPGKDIEFTIDVHSIFQNTESGKIYDIAANPQLHSLSQLPAAEELANNLAESITLKN